MQVKQQMRSSDSIAGGTGVGAQPTCQQRFAMVGSQACCTHSSMLTQCCRLIVLACADLPVECRRAGEAQPQLHGVPGLGAAAPCCCSSLGGPHGDRMLQCTTTVTTCTCASRLLPLLTVTRPSKPAPCRPAQVTAVAYDTPIPGFKTRNCINLRLWAAKPSREFDLEAFNTGDYVQVCSRNTHRRRARPCHGTVTQCVMLCCSQVLVTLRRAWGCMAGGLQRQPKETHTHADLCALLPGVVAVAVAAAVCCRPSWASSVLRRCRVCCTLMTGTMRARSCASSSSTSSCQQHCRYAAQQQQQAHQDWRTAKAVRVLRHGVVTAAALRWLPAGANRAC